MTIWRPASIDIEPEVILTDWSIVEATFEGNDSDVSRHFVGESQSGSGRVSSKIVEFDKDKMIGKTRSGRIYKLSGDSRLSSRGQYVWRSWSEINKVTSYVDVSKQYELEPPTVETKDEPSL